MQLKYAILRVFFQLEEILEQLSDEEYSRPIDLLSGATIGQHCRHIIECFQELEKGYLAGNVNYDRRKRDRRLEVQRELALIQMAAIGDKLEKPDIHILLCAEVCDTRAQDGVAGGARSTEVWVSSSYFRELVHNLDHAIHHMAMIRVGLSALTDLPLPESFGVAHSTMKFRMNNNSVNNN